METMRLNFNSGFSFLIILLIISFANLTILLDIPILRPIIGFLFLTLLPGLLILRILKLTNIDFLEKFILSWGLSISFLMFFGLLINTLSLSIGYETPLATIPLLISFDGTFIVLAVIGYKLNKEPFFSLPNLDLNTSEKVFLVIPILFPALSIFGMHIMNTTNNNIFLMILLFSIPIYVVLVCFFNQKFPNRLYSIVIFLISISLLLLLSLRSNHLIGWDTHTEYYFFQTTLNNLHWSILGHTSLDACLSISLLPTIYQSILNIRPEFLFKVLYSLIFSVSPLIIYVLSKKYIEESYAFLASCFFMFQFSFLATAWEARTHTAILFFALAMMTLFNDKIAIVKRRALFIIFVASSIVSHYSTTYIFFFIILGSFLGIEIHSKRYTFKKVVSLTTIFLFFALIFIWYSQVTEIAFDLGVRFITTTISNLNNFFIAESRAETAQFVFGKGVTQLVIPEKIDFVFSWLTFALIGIGLITLIRRYKEMSFPELKLKKPVFLKEKFEVEYFVVALACSGLLVAIIALPYISDYGVGRLYAVTITILSVFFVIGGITLSKQTFKKKIIKNFSFKKKPLLKKQKQGKNVLDNNPVRKSIDNEEGLQVRAYFIILLVLIPYFLCVSGVMYNIGSIPRSIILNSEGDLYDMIYIHDQEIIAIRWIRDHNRERQKDLKIYTDAFGGYGVKLAYDVNNYPRVYGSFFKNNKTVDAGYIYLRYVNVVVGKVYPVAGETLNITKYSHLFVGKSKIYDNRGSETWR